MASSSVLVSILLAALGCCVTAEGPRLVGGYQKKDVAGNQLFTELAHFAVGQQVGDREFFDTVLEVTDVETQVVAGTNYRITFKIAESTCRVTENYTKELCLPKTQDIKDTCTAVIYDVPWLNQRSVTSFRCGGNAAST
uniref:Putative tick cistatins 1 n=1 Tax=Amblyomma tuberculatum TaxID=48802 RepID=A0A6M2E7G7_9ACAR